MLTASFHFLGSIKFAVPLLTAIILILIGATFYESEVGTSAVQNLIYKSPWFGGLMFLLAMNLGVSALSRYPWRGARKIGFALTHLGLIVIIAGSAAVIHLGTEGLLLVRTDRAGNNQMQVDGKVIEVLTPDQNLIQQNLFIKPNGDIRPKTVGDVQLLDYAENTMQTVRFEEGERTDNLAVQLHLSSDRMGQNLTRYLALHPFSYQEIDLGMATLEMIEVELDQYLSPPQKADSPCFRILVSPDQKLYYVANSSQGFQTGELAVNQPIETGWADFEIKVNQIIPNAEIQREVIPFANQEIQNKTPGLFVQMPTGEKQWLQWGEPSQIKTNQGTFYLAFTSNLKQLPFTIHLDDFIVERNEGSQSIAMWTSKITIKNPESGEEVQREVWMNHPTWYQGWKIAQASWNPGDLEQSTLQVKREPVWLTTLTFGGSGLVVLGIAIMFYGRSISKQVAAIKPQKESTAQHAIHVN